MIACFIFACLTSYLSQASWIRKRIRQLTSRGIGMGMCGGFSTLSALVIEELTRLQADHIAGAVCYLLISFAGGLLVAYAGARLGLALTVRRMTKIAADAAMNQRQSPNGSGRHVTAGETVVMPSGSDDSPLSAPPSYEPAPITDEIPLTGDLTTGEVH